MSGGLYSAYQREQELLQVCACFVLSLLAPICVHHCFCMSAAHTYTRQTLSCLTGGLMMHAMLNTLSTT